MNIVVATYKFCRHFQNMFETASLKDHILDYIPAVSFTPRIQICELLPEKKVKDCCDDPVAITAQWSHVCFLTMYKS